MSPLEDALAKIDALNAEVEARRVRIETDARTKFCAGKIAHYSLPVIYGGMIGGMQVFGDLFTAEHARKLQARALRSARVGQIDGNHARVRAELGRAAVFRRDAKSRLSRTQFDEAA